MATRWMPRRLVEMSIDFSPWLTFEASLADWMRSFKRDDLIFTAGRLRFQGFLQTVFEPTASSRTGVYWSPWK